MAQIIVQRDPSGVTAPDVYHVKGGVNLLDWLCENEVADFGGLHCEFSLNGKQICNTWDFEPDDCNNALDINLSDKDCAVCVIRPAGVDPYTIGLLIAVAVVAAAVVIALAPSVNKPVEGDNTSSRSNQLNSSSNSYLKLGEAVDDNAGQIVKYPKFIQPSYYVYDNGQRVFTELFLIGRGRYDIGAIKDGDTPINGLPGYTIDFFEPSALVPDLLNVRLAPNSTDLDLLSNEQQTRTIQISNEGYAANDGGTGGIIDLPAALYDSLEPNVGDSITFSLTYPLSPSDPDITQSGTATITAVNAVTQTIEIDFNLIGDGVITSGFITNNSFVFVAPEFLLQGDAIEEIRYHIVMPQGIRKGDGTEAIITVKLEAQEVDALGAPIGSPIEKFGYFSGNTQSAQRQTFTINASDGLTAGRYKAKATRITDSLGDNSIDLVVLEGVESVTPYTGNFGDVTIMRMIRKSNQRVNKGASTKINCLITRKLQTFTSGATYIATRNFSDYAFYLLRDLAGVAVSNIDTTTLFGIMSGLTDPQLGYFDYQFDSKNSSLRERLEVCCNVARARYYNEGLNWSFTREESKPTRMALFNRRNLKPKSSQFVQKFREPNGYDGVTLVYVDPDKNSEKRISKYISGGAFVTGIGANMLEVNLAGCRNAAQALNRLNLEVRRLIYQNIKVTDVSIGDALTMPIGERVDWVDMFDSEIFSGEIMGQNGNVFATSERFTPQGGVQYFAYTTDDSGTPSATVEVSARSDGTIKGFEATGLSSYSANQVFQVGSRYVIASTNNYEASAYTLIGKGRPNDKGEVTIELAEYDELLFADD